jgi:hypothetical protein
MKKTIVLLAGLSLLLAFILSACQSATSTPVPPPAPTPTTAFDQVSQFLSQKVDLAPQVIETNPAPGQEVLTGGAISLSFDQAMDAATTAKALAVTGSDQKPVAGSVTWKNGRTLIFQPQQALQAGAVYLARLDTTARSAAGVQLDQAVTLSFQTVGELKISQVFPADGTKDVEGQSTITVMFNHPVVALKIAEEQASLVNPLVIDPDVKGHGEWISTSMYVFHPQGVLVGGQTYHLAVKAGLSDATGDPSAGLKQDFTWAFSVAAPSIDSVSLNDEDLKDALVGAPLNPTLQIVFRQPMDARSVESALHLRAAGKDAPLQAQWDKTNTQVVLKPSQLLSLGAAYTLFLDSSARAADGGGLAAGFSRTFTTVPYPAIAKTTPFNGAANAVPNFQIFFAGPMDFKSLADRVTFSPFLDTKTHSWYNSYDNSLSFYGLNPSTQYTVRILPGMRDPYGNAILAEMDVTFTTQPLDPSAMLLMPYQPVFRASGSQDFYLRYVNLTSVSAQLYHLSFDQFVKVVTTQYGKGGTEYTGDEKDLVWQFADKPTAKTDEVVTKDLTMTDSGGQPLAAGFYFLGIQASPVQYTQHFLDNRLFYVSTENITVKVSPGQVLAWVTDLKTGVPTVGVRVKVLDDNFVQVAEGVTDASGLYQAAVNTDLNPPSPDKNNYQSSWYVIVDDPHRFAFASSQWGSGASFGSVGLYDQVYRPWNSLTAYVYTERPLYRPGQPVYFKGIVRSDDDLAYSLPSQTQVEVTISDYKQQVYKETLPLSEIGTFDGVFHLSADANLGSYTLSVQLPGGQNALGAAAFDVAEYRRPEFQIDLQAAPANLLAGDSFNVNLSASYYSGGGLSNADVAWTLRSEPFTFNPPADYDQFSFSNDLYDNWDYFNSKPSSQTSGQIAEGQGQTDGDGKFSIPLKAQPTTTNTSQQLVFEATVTDFSGSSVSGQAQVVMHQSAVYPGIRSKSYVGQVGLDQPFELVALDWDGKPLAGAKVDVDIVERKWSSVQQETDSGQLTWKTTVEENPVAHFSGVQLDDKGLGTVSFKPAKDGIYRAKITAQDAHGNQAQASAFIWVAGTDFVPWAQTNDRSFQLVADRQTYSPGDTADLLIASPFQGESYALVTVERGHVRQAEVVKLQGNSTVYHLPVTPDMAPNVYVSVIVVKGIDETNPRPNFKVGLVKLNVTTGAQTLKVTISTDHDQAAPQQKVLYTVQTTTLDGKPVPAEVSLALSDLATLSLKTSTVPPLLDFFYAPRSLSVTTSVAIIQSIEDYNATISKSTQATGQGAGSGGGKGSGYTGVMEIRQDFPDTAFWQAQVETGTDGKATVSLTLPDNLTTWRMDARAVTADTRVGQATLDLVSTRPLLVLPQTPRFAVVGDQLTLGAAVHNNTGGDLNVVVKLDASGVTLAGPAAQNVTIPAKHQAYVTWDATVPAGSLRMDLVFSAEGGGYQDASRPTLGTLDNQGIPVYRFESPETVGTSGIVSDNGGHTEAISLPSTMTVQKGQLNIELATSLAAGMTDGLTYLQEYPYECIEQTISRFLPNIRLNQALQAAGVSDPALQDNLKTQVNLALQKLYSAQNPDGGWGWWGGMNSDVLTTAYAVLGLSEARAAGYSVNNANINNAISFLDTHLQSFSDLTPAQDLNRQAFVLYVLARSGSPDVSKTVQLYDQRQSMGLYARGFLLQTLHAIDPADPRLKTLISDLSNAAILSAAGTHWEEKTADPWNWNTDERSTAIILAALIETDPQNGLNANAVRWVMVNRKNGRWNSTQETTWSLLALTDWVSSTSDLKPNYNYGAAFNGNVLVQGTATPQTIRETKQVSVDVTQMLTDQANRLVVARDGSAGSLYYTAYLNVWLPVTQVQALDRGVVISRQYFRPDDLTKPVTEAKQGDVLLARLTVTAADTLRFLHVDDPLPAGMEAVDTSLNTSPQAQQPLGYDWTRIDTDGWGWWFFSHIELRDEKVVLSTDVLPAGTYVYTYLVRASTPGTFNVMPPTAQEFYFPDVYGRGNGSQFVIKP